jgi:gentisate 1,2-dioxygenase
MLNDYIKAYEYESNVNPPLKSIPISTKNIKDCDFGIQFIDFSEIYNVNFKATSPNLLASFIKIEGNYELSIETKEKNSNFNASSHLFFIMEGNCEIILDKESFKICKGDLFICPCFSIMNIVNQEKEELQIYYINDSPLVNYLGTISINKIFKASIYSSEFLKQKMNELSNPNNNRKGILLSNKDTEKIGINTITPVLWSLYNELPPHTKQKVHKHNSVALDLCINCSDSENIFTLLGNEIDKDGNIVNPTKVNWVKGEMFITPPGLWHSHNNLGDTYAYILPIQDAGLLLFQRILGIELYK